MFLLLFVNIYVCIYSCEKYDALRRTEGTNSLSMQLEGQLCLVLTSAFILDTSQLQGQVSKFKCPPPLHFFLKFEELFDERNICMKTNPFHVTVSSVEYSKKQNACN